MPKHDDLKRYQPMRSPRPAIRKRPRDADRPAGRLARLTARYRRDLKLAWSDAILLARHTIQKRGQTFGLRGTFGVTHDKKTQEEAKAVSDGRNEG